MITVKILTIFLPVNIPQESHSQGFRLWLTEFFTIWQNVSNKTQWEHVCLLLHDIDIYSIETEVF